MIWKKGLLWLDVGTRGITWAFLFTESLFQFSLLGPIEPEIAIEKAKRKGDKNLSTGTTNIIMNRTVSVYNSSFHCLGSIWRQFTWNHPRNRCVLTFHGDMFSMQSVAILSVSVRESTAFLGRMGPLSSGQMPDPTKITGRCFLPPQICNKTDWSLKQI